MTNEEAVKSDLEFADKTWERMMRDGTYQVTTKHFVAGFVIKAGKLIACAPILKRNFLFWAKLAKKVPEMPCTGLDAEKVNTSEA